MRWCNRFIQGTHRSFHRSLRRRSTEGKCSYRAEDSAYCSAVRKSASLIKKCNDFGAGGVSVAIGELADGLRINLDKVPKKYAGLDGTEIAISESQERMAVVVDPADVKEFLTVCK